METVSESMSMDGSVAREAVPRKAVCINMDGREVVSMYE
jgi:hypothetical protein